MKRSVVLGVGSALPRRRVTNDELAESVDTSDEWIVERTGIRERRVGGSTSGLAIEAGRQAMENLLQKEPSINLVYTINEPAAAGAYEALKSVGLEGSVTIVSVDGGCPGIARRVGPVAGTRPAPIPRRSP